MKKLFLLLFVLGTGLSMQAQTHDWGSLAQLHKDELYPLAKDVADITDKVMAHGNMISIIKSTGTVSLKLEIDKSVSVDVYTFRLLTSTGKSIKLTDQLTANKVVNKFFDVLRRVKENSQSDQKQEVEDILDSL
ncbi:hypothetical protein ABW636_19115 [Aquimarina sp. 2201CG1-2-11]|uniref:hypothetical protein n=1 Tax=Aquimarina discodermiae TaxID=3231043 RepID=UPI0034631E00